jgi:hypothetical protein
LPDIKIFLPDLGSGFADAGWISEFGSSSSNASQSSLATTSSPQSADILTPFDVASDARDSTLSGLQSGIG